MFRLDYYVSQFHFLTHLKVKLGLIYPLKCFFNIKDHPAQDRNLGLGYNTLLLQVSVYCDGVGCHVLCLRHGIPVWQHIGQSTTAISRHRCYMTSDV